MLFQSALIIFQKLHHLTQQVPMHENNEHYCIFKKITTLASRFSGLEHSIQSWKSNPKKGKLKYRGCLTEKILQKLGIHAWQQNKYIKAVTIVQISQLHFSFLNKKEFLKKIGSCRSDMELSKELLFPAKVKSKKKASQL